MPNVNPTGVSFHESMASWRIGFQTLEPGGTTLERHDVRAELEVLASLAEKVRRLCGALPAGWESARAGVERALTAAGDGEPHRRDRRPGSRPLEKLPPRGRDAGSLDSLSHFGPPSCNGIPFEPPSLGRFYQSGPRHAIWPPGLQKRASFPNSGAQSRVSITGFNHHKRISAKPGCPDTGLDNGRA